MKRVIVVVWLLGMVLPALAEPPRRPAPPMEKSESRTHKLGKKFWFTFAALGVAMVADGESQLRLQRKCPTCAEANPLYFARRPSRARFYLVGSGIFVAQAWLGRRMKAAETGWPKRVWWAPAAAETALHVGYAVHNLQLPHYHGCPAGQTINCTR